jgi:hypothetical protein
MWQMLRGPAQRIVSGMNMLRTALITVLTGGLCLGTSVPPAHAEGASQSVGGGFTTAACAITEFTPDPVTPTSGHFTCTTSSQWIGTWTGASTMTVRGTIDLLTSAATGTADETFVGRASDGTTGSLHIFDTFTLTPDGFIRDVASILEGSGDWTGATGEADFDGFNDFGVGFGGYRGQWSRPGH